MIRKTVLAVSECAFAAAVLFAPIDAQAACRPASPCAAGPLDLGDLTQGRTPDPNFLVTYATGISGDGSAISGYANLADPQYSNLDHAFIWRRGVMTDLGTLGGIGSNGLNINRSGTIVVGASTTLTGENHAFRWKASSGMLDLGTLGGTNSAAWAVNDEGSVIVGQSDAVVGPVPHQETHAFRWTPGKGMQDLGTAGTSSIAFDVSGRGDVVVGYRIDGSGNNHAFRWTPRAGMTDLAGLPGTGSIARAISRDGLVIVGSLAPLSGGDRHPFRWTAAGGSDLGVLGGTGGEALGVNRDGSIVVGWSTQSSGPVHATRWTAASGLRDLNILLTAAGVNMNGIALSYANAVSADGQFIAAQGGAAPGDNRRAYLVRYLDAARHDDRPIAAVTTPQAVQRSIDDLAFSRQVSLIEQQAFADPSATAGQTRFALAPGLEMLAQASFSAETAFRSAAEPQARLSLRYTDGEGPVAPFVEFGGWSGSAAPLKFERNYANGAGLATGEGLTQGRAAKAFARSGLIWQPSDGDRVMLSAELAQDWLTIEGYQEPLSAANPFESAAATATDQMTSGKLRLEWTHDVSAGARFGLWTAFGRSFGGAVDLTASVPGLGVLNGAGYSSIDWIELGSRASFRLSPNLSTDLYAGAITHPLGTSAHLRADLRLSF